MKAGHPPAPLDAFADDLPDATLRGSIAPGRGGRSGSAVPSVPAGSANRVEGSRAPEHSGARLRPATSGCKELNNALDNLRQVC